MLSQNDGEKKLDWMYKGANSLVDREDYLLGRSVDKTLEQLNTEEKEKAQGYLAPPKNHVEHECIPPSIRDFNKIVQAEQVDLSAKLQEDPLVAIKKREEEARRQFLQNPVQLKKLQKALKAQQEKKHKKKHKKSKRNSSDSESDLDNKLAEKLRLLKGGSSKIPLGKKKSKDSSLDTILMHKFNELKNKLSEDDLKNILAGNISDSDEDKKKSSKKRRGSTSSEDDQIKRKEKYVEKRERDDKSNRRKGEAKNDKHRKTYDDYKPKSRSENRKSEPEKTKHKTRSPSRSLSDSSDEEGTHKYPQYSSKRYDSDEEQDRRPKTWGLVTSDGTKIPLKKHKHTPEKTQAVPSKQIENEKKPPQKKAKKLTDEEKDRLRREMMQNAQWRDKERIENVRKYRENERKDEEARKSAGYKSDFAHRELLRSANSSSVESRIKANLNKIQRSSRHMESNFSKRH